MPDAQKKEHGLSADEIDGMLVRIVSDNHPNFIGEARDFGEHGWIEVHLDALDIEDTRVIGPMGPDEVELYDMDATA